MSDRDQRIRRRIFAWVDEQARPRSRILRLIGWKRIVTLPQVDRRLKEIIREEYPEVFG